MLKSRRSFIAEVVSGAYGLPYAAARAAETCPSPIESAATSGSSISRVKSVLRRDGTITRYPCNGDIFPMTWVRGDRQVSSFSDGLGWPRKHLEVYNTRAIEMVGDPADLTFEEIPGYPDLPNVDPAHRPLYYGFGLLSVDATIYQYLCSYGKPAPSSGLRWDSVKLIYSPDRGRTWLNQDGTTPVSLETYDQQSRKTMLFLSEPQQAFSLVSLLQMGRDYQLNSDGYVYGCGPNGNTDGTMNQLVMFRVPKARVLERSAYEFFGGFRSRDEPIWSSDIHARDIVHHFPRGWVNSTSDQMNVVQSWLPSVVYNAPLGLYLMAGSGVGCRDNGDWAKPSYLGLWTAPEPWGPWTQIYEDTAWTPGNDGLARCYSPQIAPKWIAADGRSFWLVWSDFQQRCDEAEERRFAEEVRRLRDHNQSMRMLFEQGRHCSPYYAFNAQRFDLVV